MAKLSEVLYRNSSLQTESVIRIPRQAHSLERTPMKKTSNKQKIKRIILIPGVASTSQLSQYPLLKHPFLTHRFSNSLNTSPKKLFRHNPSRLSWWYASPTSQPVAAYTTTIRSKNKSVQGKKLTNQIPNISIPGFEQIIHPHSPFAVKAIWLISLLICTSACVYYTGKCIHHFFRGKPGTTLEFVKESAQPVPSITICPSDIYGYSKLTANLKRKYCRNRNDNSLCKRARFNEIDIADIIDEISIEDIWTVFNFTVLSTSYQCSVNKNDKSCAVQYVTKPVATVGGECMSLVTENSETWKLPSAGPVGVLDITADFENSSETFSLQDVVLKIIQHNRDEDVAFVGLDYGLFTPVSFNAKATLEVTKITLLNVSHNPCFKEKEVEDCFAKCLERNLYKHIKCRLPFMKTESLPQCRTSQEFKEALNATKKTLSMKRECANSCPRICEKYFVTYFIDLVKITDKQQMHILVAYTGPILRSIKEVNWYTFGLLLADIGGNVGFFLNVNFLTIVEIIEMIIFLIRKLISVRGRTGGNQTTISTPFVPNIATAGFGRIFNRNTKLRRKCIWILIVFLFTVILFIEINDTIFDYNEGEPSVNLTFEMNDSIKLPTITLCPFKPFDYNKNIQELKEQYIYEVNVTKDIRKVSVADLVGFMDIKTIWEEARVDKSWVILAEANGKTFSSVDAIEAIQPPLMRYITTILGTCISLTVETMFRYHGLSTNFLIQSVTQELENSPYLYVVYLHNDEDDPRTLDIHNALLISNQLFQLRPMALIKQEYLNRKKAPCSEALTVAKCRSKCLDDFLTDKMPCRLPFIHNYSKHDCNSSQEFLEAMDVATEFYHEKLINFVCKCPRKCQEYIISSLNDATNMMASKNIKLNIIVFYLMSNIFTYVKEYRRLTPETLFASICGNLGLFLGFCALSVIEILEFLWFKGFDKI